jgi:fluoride exporter
LRIVLLIAFGTLGTLARYALGGLVQERAHSTFPSGTLVVNLIGCFLLGGIAEYALLHLTIPPDWRVGITVGFFGAFTTFSSFTWETARMLQDGQWRAATVYVLASVIGGIIGVFLGMKIADRI